MMQKIFYFIVVTLLLTSCEKVINMDLPIHQSQIVTNCLFTNDSTFTVHLTKSLGSLDNAPIPAIDNAQVDLYENEHLISSLQSAGDGYYTSGSFVSSSSRNYRIVVNAPGMDVTEASSYSPSPVSCNYTFKDSASLNKSGEPEAELNITFIDPAGENNYYEISVFYSDSLNKNNQNGTFYNSVYVRGQDPILEEGYNDKLLFNDQSINGQSHSILLVFSSNQIETKKDLYLSFRSLSEEYYKYMKSVTLHYNNQDNPFAEPVQVYTNFKTGFGIFAGSSETRYLLQ